MIISLIVLALSLQAVLEFPLHVSVPGQPLPVDFTVRTQITSSDMELSPTHLNFGSCPVTEYAGVPVTLFNPSKLPQTYSFGNLPMGVKITPNDGFGRVLPGKQG